MIAQNIRYLYLEIAFSAVMGAIVTFNSAFAIRLGASDGLIALLGSAPALIAVMLSIPAGRFFTARRNRKPWILASLVASRVGYLVVALIPLLYPIQTATWLVIWLILTNIPSAIFTAGWTALLGDLIPENQRALVVSHRSIIWSLAVALVGWLSGQWLDRVAFPINYQWLYAFGLVFLIGNQYYLNRLVVTQFKAAPKPAVPLQRSATSVKLSGPMKRMLVNTAVYQFGLNLPGPLFNVFYINTLNAKDSWIGLNSAAGSIGVIIGYLIWERIYRRRSFDWGLQRSSLITWIFPVGAAFFPSLNFILLLSLLVNMIHSGNDLSSFNVLHKLAGPDERQAYVSWYVTVANFSLFAAPLVGVWLAGYIGIPATFLLSGLFRFVGGILFNINDIEKPNSQRVAAAH